MVSRSEWMGDLNSLGFNSSSCSSIQRPGGNGEAAFHHTTEWQLCLLQISCSSSSSNSLWQFLLPSVQVIHTACRQLQALH